MLATFCESVHFGDSLSADLTRWRESLGAFVADLTLTESCLISLFMSRRLSNSSETDCEIYVCGVSEIIMTHAVIKPAM